MRLSFPDYVSKNIHKKKNFVTRWDRDKKKIQTGMKKSEVEKKECESIDKKYTNYNMNLWHRSPRDTLFSAPISREPGSEF